MLHWEPKRKKPRLPPSPRKLPLIGNLHQLGSLPHRSLQVLSERHGPHMLLHMGRVPTLVVSSAEAAREVMKAQDAIFACRRQFQPLHVLSHGSRSINASRYGEQYRRQGKKAAVVHLLSPKRVQSFRQLREEEVAVMLDKITAAPSPSTVDLNEVLNSFVAALVGRIVIGCRSSGDERTKRFQELLAEGNELVGGLRLDDAFPCIAWLWRFPCMDSKLTKLFKKWDAFLNQMEEHDRREQEGDGDSEGDYVDILLSLCKDPYVEFSLSREDMKAMLLEMLGAGTDTSCTVLEWTMAELIRNPGAMRRAQNEVREIARGKPMATEDDVAQMSYLRAVVKEWLRLHPPSPLLLPRESTEDTQLQGYDIPMQNYDKKFAVDHLYIFFMLILI